MDYLIFSQILFSSQKTTVCQIKHNNLKKWVAFYNEIWFNIPKLKDKQKNFQPNQVICLTAIISYHLGD